MTSTEIPPRQTPNEKSLVFILKLGQILGLLPLEFSEDDEQENRDVRFIWKSYKIVYSLIQLGMQGGMVGLCGYFGYTAGWKFRNIVRLIFYTSNLCTMLEFFRLTRKLPGLLTKWYKLDAAMLPNYGYPKNVYRRIKIMAAFALVYATVQMTWFIGYNCINVKIKANDRNLDYKSEYYFKAVYPQVFQKMSYSPWLGIIFQVHYMFSFLRAVYADLFISLMSTILSLRFKQVTSRLSMALDKKSNVAFWMEMREDYDRICNLCRSVDDCISNTIFVTFGSDLSLLMVYLYNCTIFEDLNLQKAYNISAFIMLMIRILIMLLYVAWINDESKEPAHILNSVSTSQYNSEIQRFLLQVNFEEISFTGNKMFKMTRSLIMDVGGVILTYELILVQFSELNFFT